MRVFYSQPLPKASECRNYLLCRDRYSRKYSWSLVTGIGLMFRFSANRVVVNLLQCSGAIGWHIWQVALASGARRLPASYLFHMLSLFACGLTIVFISQFNINTAFKKEWRYNKRLRELQIRGSRVHLAASARRHGTTSSVCQIRGYVRLSRGPKIERALCCLNKLIRFPSRLSKLSRLPGGTKATWKTDESSLHWETCSFLKQANNRSARSIIF